MPFVYTVAEFEEIKKKYAEGTSLEVLATEYSKSVASIRMKLVKAGVYNKVSSHSTSEQRVAAPKPKRSSSSMTKREFEDLCHEMYVLYKKLGPAPV